MELLKRTFFRVFTVLCIIVFFSSNAFSDDTCVFQVTADDLPPNIVILLDSGAEMEQIAWPSVSENGFSFNNSVDYTPFIVPDDRVDVLDLAQICGTGCADLTLSTISNNSFSSGKTVEGQISHATGDPIALNGNILSLKDVSGDYHEGENIIGDSGKGAGTIAIGGVNKIEPNGFFNERGYGVIVTGNEYYLVNIPENLQIDEYTMALKANSSNTATKKGTWTINGRTITLPAEPSTVLVNGVKDNASNFRYSKNYLNWLFFSTGAGSYIESSALDDGTDLPDKSRFYYAKKAILTVASGTGLQARFGLYYFSNDTGASNAQPLGFTVEDDGVTPEPNFTNNVNNMGTVTYSPLAEGLSTVGYYYSSPSSGASGGYCQQNFALVISPGVSSMDQGTTSKHVPAALSDYDKDDLSGNIGEGKIKPTRTGILVVSNPGAFQDGETLTESDTGVTATVEGTINSVLTYYSKTADFTVGEIITGATSGATATVINTVTVQPTISGTSGGLELTGVTDGPDGSFLPNELITGNSGGSANIEGSLVSTLHFKEIDADSFTEGKVITGGSSNATATILASVPNDIPVNLNGSTYLDDIAYYLYANDVVGDGVNEGALLYDGKVASADFTIGAIITGVSGAQGKIDDIIEDGDPETSTSGTLVLSNITGIFENNEIITDSHGGSATVNGKLYDSGEGVQNVLTYTIGFMGDDEGNRFLINTSNNGNGNKNLYDTTDENYGKYHFTADSPEALSEQLLEAVNDILSRTNTFTAPVVPVTRTTSGNRIYMAFFKPGDSNFWEGNVTKFGISDNNEILDAYGNPATWPNGAIKDIALPYWSTKDWAITLSNDTRDIYTYLGSSTTLTNSSNEFRTSNTALTSSILGSPVNGRDNIINYVRGADAFDEDSDSNTTENRTVITGDVLHSEPMVFQYRYYNGTSETMVYFGSNDGMLHAVLDIDTSGNNQGSERWAFIPPDQLHRLKDMKEGFGHQYYVDSTPRVYFYDINGNGIVEAGDVDSSGTVEDDEMDRVILVCGERKGGTSYFALDVTDPAVPKYLWRVTNRDDSRPSGSFVLTDIVGTWQSGDWAIHYPDSIPDPSANDYSGYNAFANLSSAPDGSGNVTFTQMYHPLYMDIGDKVYSWRSSNCEGSTASCFSHNAYATIAEIHYDDPLTPVAPTTYYSEIGETWSEPSFGLVKTSDSDTVGTPVVFLGAGYDSDNSKGRAVIVINALTGYFIRSFYTGSYSIPSTVAALDTDSNGFTDKLYVGDMGGRMWRIGRFTYYAGDPEGTYSAGDPIPFPGNDENIYHWNAEAFFKADNTYTRKFFYPPSVALEKSYDLVMMGTGDRDDACKKGACSDCASPDPYPDKIMAVKDDHTATTASPIVAEILSGTALQAHDLVDITNAAATPPNLDDSTSDADTNGEIDKGWYLRLVDAGDNAVGEKVLAEGSLFYKVFYVTTFTPNDDPCLPGGEGKVYALSYKTGASVLDFNNDGTPERSLVIGGGIPSKPVIIITDDGVKQFISVGSTNPDDNSEDEGAGILAIDPTFPDINFFYLWWKDR